MENEELKNVDFNLATMQMLVTTAAMSQTILENQMYIMERLSMGTNQQIQETVNKTLQRNLEKVSQDLKTKIPAREYLKFPIDGWES